MRNCAGGNYKGFEKAMRSAPPRSIELYRETFEKKKHDVITEQSWKPTRNIEQHKARAARKALAHGLVVGVRHFQAARSEPAAVSAADTCTVCPSAASMTFAPTISNSPAPPGPAPAG